MQSGCIARTATNRAVCRLMQKQHLAGSTQSYDTKPNLRRGAQRKELELTYHSMLHPLSLQFQGIELLNGICLPLRLPHAAPILADSARI